MYYNIGRKRERGNIAEKADRGVMFRIEMEMSGVTYKTLSLVSGRSIKEIKRDIEDGEYRDYINVVERLGGRDLSYLYKYAEVEPIVVIRKKIKKEREGKKKDE